MNAKDENPRKEATKGKLSLPDEARQERAHAQAQAANAPPHSPANGAATANPTFPTTVSRKLKGRIFDVPFKPDWTPGHVLSYDEALFINVARAGYITSAYSDVYEGMIAKDREGGPLSDKEITTHFHDYALSYEWSPRGDGSTLDPVEAEMRKIARNELTHQLKTINRTLVGLPKEKQAEALSLYMTKHERRLRQTAEANITQAQSFGDMDFLAQIGAPELKQASKPAAVPAS